MRCLSSARFNLLADILRQGVAVATPDSAELGSGEYVDQQDPLTHQIVRVWVPSTDNITTPSVDESIGGTVPCMVRGIIDGGIRVAGTTERFGEIYENIDYARMWLPSSFVITKRDRITNIRNKQGIILWKDEETYTPTSGNYRSTVFDVLGITPIIDAFGQHVENVAMLQKAEVYANG